jgi:hypothetical protein
MTTFFASPDTPVAVAGHSSAWHRLLDTRIEAARRKIAQEITGFLAGVRDGRALAARYDELSRLTNAELGQRGLVREGIVRAVLAGGGV